MNTYIRLGFLCTLTALCTFYAQKPSNDIVEETVVSASTMPGDVIEVIETIDFGELAGMSQEDKLEQANEITDADVVVQEIDSDEQPQEEVVVQEVIEEETALRSEVQEQPAVQEEEESQEFSEKTHREESDDVYRDTSKGAPVADMDLSLSDLTFDIEHERKATIDLVHRAAEELKNQTLDVAANRFTHTKKFIHGALYIFLFDMKGTCLAHGEDAHLVWQDMYNVTDWVGTPFIKHIIKKAKNGGGWVTYGWNGVTKTSYVKLVEKEGVSYAIGAGYYPQSKEEAVVNVVKGAVAMFNQIKKSKEPADWAFSRMSYPKGQFVAGDLYLYALDFKGTIVAQGERPGLINSNSWNYKDKNGLYVNQDIIKKLQVSTSGVWVEYVSKRAIKKAYAQKVKSIDGTQYFIACGYYPDANRDQTIELVRKGYQFMKMHGKTGAIRAFSQRKGDEFRYGDLSLIVYDMKGKVIADGKNADNIGRNLYESRDEDGHLYVQKILERSTKEGVWTNAKINGSFQSNYAQKIDLGIATYVIVSSYYPVSKPEAMTLLVQSGASYLKANPRETAFADFVKRDGRFQRGDLKLIAVDTTGLCYAYGDDADLIWRNIFKAKDDDGRPFIKLFINEAGFGPSVVKTKLNGVEKTNFVTAVEKDGKTYVLASGYYQ